MKARSLGKRTEKATAVFKATMDGISGYTQVHVRPLEKFEALPDLTWNLVQGEANHKHAQAVLNFASAESKNIENELARQTLADKTRQMKADADRSESLARQAVLDELMARVALVEKCRGAGVIPLWDKSGGMSLLPAPEHYDWDGLIALLTNGQAPSMVEEANTDSNSKGSGFLK